jgi:hypothetical protein
VGNDWDADLAERVRHLRERDPGETLTKARDHTARGQAGGDAQAWERESLVEMTMAAELFEALDAWLCAGGPLPEQWSDQRRDSPPAAGQHLSLSGSRGPGETLQQARAFITRAHENGDAGGSERHSLICMRLAAELFQELDAWLSDGGRLPEQWAPPPGSH